MSIGEMVGIICSSVLAVYSVISNLILSIKNKNKAKTSDVLENQNSAYSILKNVPLYVKEAESIFGKGNGVAKCQWVLTKVQLDAVKSNIELSDEYIKSEIELILSTPEKKQTINQRSDIKE